MSTNRSFRTVTQELWRSLGHLTTGWTLLATVRRNRLERHTHAQDSESIVRQVLNEIKREHGEQGEQRPDPGKGSIQQAGGKEAAVAGALRRALEGLESCLSG